MALRAVNELCEWLISPDGNWCFRFCRDSKSLGGDACVLVDKWIASQGMPVEMRFRQKLQLDQALELAAEMLLDGWDKLQDQLIEEDEEAA